MANELAPHSIRVNTVNPTGVNTPMIDNDVTRAYIAAHAAIAGTAMQNAMPVEMIEAQDVTEAILWLVSDAARYVTGVVLPVDAGFTVR
jgi:NAD(P)-dependent dehydrogenase (short-subunit alcohol dehydrogenase family)